MAIHESFSKKEESQRRPGLLVALPGTGVGTESFWFFGWICAYKLGVWFKAIEIRPDTNFAVIVGGNIINSIRNES